MTAPTDKNILQPFLGSYKKQQLSRSSHSAKTERESFRVVRWTPRHHLRSRRILPVSLSFSLFVCKKLS
ncbi:hypothetical protein T07_10205 [Trichinella nelsoni]|uniref:Uncharacterized protein n=1 Tax=Trichinella nelsoni TaxID=6336 RepID=A0A0V0RCI2_9BILA|nr:hypothetical protein T07_10205 [Trichinella nelsoni]